MNLRELLRRLHGMGVKRLLLEGGGTLNWSMLASRLVVEIRVTIAPVLVGGQMSTTLVEGHGVEKIADAFKLSLIGVRRTGSEIALNYEVA